MPSPRTDQPPPSRSTLEWSSFDPRGLPALIGRLNVRLVLALAIVALVGPHHLGHRHPADPPRLLRRADRAAGRRRRRLHRAVVAGGGDSHRQRSGDRGDGRGARAARLAHRAGRGGARRAELQRDGHDHQRPRRAGGARVTPEHRGARVARPAARHRDRAVCPARAARAAERRARRVRGHRQRPVLDARRDAGADSQRAHRRRAAGARRVAGDRHHRRPQPDRADRPPAARRRPRVAGTARRARRPIRRPARSTSWASSST